METAEQIIRSTANDYIYTHAAEIGHTLAEAGVARERIKDAIPMIGLGFDLCIAAIITGDIPPETIVRIAEVMGREQAVETSLSN